MKKQTTQSNLFLALMLVGGFCIYFDFFCKVDKVLVSCKIIKYKFNKFSKFVITSVFVSTFLNFWVIPWKHFQDSLGGFEGKEISILRNTCWIEKH